MNAIDVKARRPWEGSRGSALMSMVMLSSLLLLIPIGLKMTSMSRQQAKLESNAVAEAENAARAGLVDGLAWFRSRPTQPVHSGAPPTLWPFPDAAFSPQAAPGDTIDASVGLVKEYLLDSNASLWARYELKRQNVSSPVDPHAVHDITGQRSLNHVAGEGLYWYIESAGTIYRRKNPDVPYNRAPNQIIGSARVATEIRRVSVAPPVNTAVLVNAINNVTLDTNSGAQIVGGNSGAGISYYSGSPGANPYITGNPALQHLGAGGPISPDQVFDVSAAELKALADVSVTGVSSLPPTEPAMTLLYVNGDAVFGDSHPLRGSGVLFVNGDLTVHSSQSALWSGLIYVTGDADIYGPALISGCLVVQGSLTMRGNGDVAKVSYDSSILNSVAQQVGQYRENKGAFYAMTGVK
jgi:hypothetical protein